MLFFFNHFEMNRLLVVHCGFDGLAAAVVAIGCGFDGDIYSTKANTVDEEMLSRYDDIAIVDMTVPLELMQSHSSSLIRVFDHHVRNTTYNRFPGSVVDPRYSSSQLYYEAEWKSYPEFDHFIRLVELVVHWKQTDSHFNEAIDLLHFYTSHVTRNTPNFTDRLELIYTCSAVAPSTFKSFIERMTNVLLIRDGRFDVADRIRIQQEKDILERNCEKADRSLLKRKDALGRKYGLCYTSGNRSLVLMELLKRHHSIEYILGYQRIPQMVRIYARSRTVDLNEYEGLEGHPQAAGGLYTLERFDELLREGKHLTVSHTFTPKWVRGMTPSELLKRSKPKSQSTQTSKSENVKLTSVKRTSGKP